MICMLRMVCVISKVLKVGIILCRAHRSKSGWVQERSGWVGKGERAGDKVSWYLLCFANNVGCHACTFTKMQVRIQSVGAGFLLIPGGGKQNGCSPNRPPSLLFALLEIDGTCIFLSSALARFVAAAFIGISALLIAVCASGNLGNQLGTLFRQCRLTP